MKINIGEQNSHNFHILSAALLFIFFYFLLTIRLFTRRFVNDKIKEILNAPEFDAPSFISLIEQKAGKLWLEKNLADFFSSSHRLSAIQGIQEKLGLPFLCELRGRSGENILHYLVSLTSKPATTWIGANAAELACLLKKKDKSSISPYAALIINQNIELFLLFSQYLQPEFKKKILTTRLPSLGAKLLLAMQRKKTKRVNHGKAFLNCIWKDAEALFESSEFLALLTELIGDKASENKQMQRFLNKFSTFMQSISEKCNTCNVRPVSLHKQSSAGPSRLPPLMQAEKTTTLATELDAIRLTTLSPDALTAQLCELPSRYEEADFYLCQPAATQCLLRLYELQRKTPSFNNSYQILKHILLEKNTYPYGERYLDAWVNLTNDIEMFNPAQLTEKVRWMMLQHQQARLAELETASPLFRALFDSEHLRTLHDKAQDAFIQSAATYIEECLLFKHKEIITMLASYLPGEIYITGGAVRESLYGFFHEATPDINDLDFLLVFSEDKVDLLFSELAEIRKLTDLLWETSSTQAGQILSIRLYGCFAGKKVNVDLAITHDLAAARGDSPMNRLLFQPSVCCKNQLPLLSPHAADLGFEALDHISQGVPPFYEGAQEDPKRFFRWLSLCLRWGKFIEIQDAPPLSPIFFDALAAIVGSKSRLFSLADIISRAFRGNNPASGIAFFDGLALFKIDLRKDYPEIWSAVLLKILDKNIHASTLLSCYAALLPDIFSEEGQLKAEANLTTETTLLLTLLAWRTKNEALSELICQKAAPITGKTPITGAASHLFFTALQDSVNIQNEKDGEAIYFFHRHLGGGF